MNTKTLTLTLILAGALCVPTFAQGGMGAGRNKGAGNGQGMKMRDGSGNGQGMKMRDGSGNGQGQKMRNGAGNGQGMRLLRGIRQLDLTEGQKAQLKVILQDEAKQIKALRADTDLSQSQKQEKMKSIRIAGHDRVMNILTKDQKDKLAKICKAGPNAQPKPKAKLKGAAKTQK